MRAELTESRLAPKRVFAILIIWISSIAGTVYLCKANELRVDILYAYVTMTVVFCSCISILLYRRRITGAFYTGAGYIILSIITVLCWIGTIFYDRYTSENYFYPIIIVPFLYCAVSDAVTATFFSLYFCLFPAMIGTDSIYVLYCHLLMAMIGSVFAGLRKSYVNKFRIPISAITILTAVFCPVAFYYFTYLDLPELKYNNNLYIYCGVVLVVVLIISEVLLDLSLKERSASYEKILDDEYSLIQDIRIFSAAEYNHAKKVSWLSGLCAEEIGADRLTAMAGGMYYRLGRVVGEPHIKNAVKTAYAKCFPTEVISILEEYEAEVKLPSTKESAIVHMVDAIITRVEAFGENVSGSDWNQDMVVYQTLNEYSQDGIYDESGISMNQFLKIRDKLLKEELV